MKAAKLLLALAALYLLPLSVSAQLTEDFNDGDFDTSPPWSGSPDCWTVNSNSQLQSNNTIANSTYYITTANTLATNTLWEFSVTLSFNTSSANYVDVFLTASDSLLPGSKTTGYFVRIGNTEDEISLYRKDSAGSVIEIIDGANGITNTSSSRLKIKVIRDAGNKFQLFYQTANSGSFTSGGSVVDSTFSASAYFGFLVRQSTSSFFQKHFFDDILIQPYAPDTIPPAIQSLTAASANALDVLFSEPVDAASAQSVSNYMVTGMANPASAQIDGANASLVRLTFGNNFKNGIEHTLTITNVKDLAGNKLDKDSATFSFYTPQRFDMVIDEIMADPTPVVALPNAEYIELKNMSGRNLNLKGWRLTTTSSISGPFPEFIVPVDSFVIITSTSAALEMAPYGKVLGVGNFPALDNDGTTLTLLAGDASIIHSVSYHSGWYQNEVKANGGWSLEMIDTHFPCSGQSNWKASTGSAGGTPGKKNAADGINKDVDAPLVAKAFLKDSITIVLHFNEPVDSSAAADVSHYNLEPAIALKEVEVTSPDMTGLVLKLAAPLSLSTVYTLSLTGITDCAGNEINSEDKVLIGRPQTPGSRDIVINEILFNPRPNAYDYIELYNRGDKLIDASTLYIANRRDTGTAGSLKKLSETPLYIFPGDHWVITEDAASLQQNYLVKNPTTMITVSSLPSLPDDKGAVVLLNGKGKVIDEVAYTKDWHFALITEDEGVALERIDPEAASQNKDNWHSAASTAGYGTPTHKNSQYRQSDKTGAAIEVIPKIFSPDNDGYEDLATVNYQLSETGYVANILIFDASGRLVRSLVKNGTLALKGSWIWDGLDEKKQRLPMGTYIIYTELFNLQGKKMQFKNVVVLARKL